MEHWKPGSWGRVHGDHWPPLTLQVETPGPWLGVAQQLDLRCQVAWTP